MLILLRTYSPPEKKWPSSVDGPTEPQFWGLVPCPLLVDDGPQELLPRLLTSLDIVSHTRRLHLPNAAVVIESRWMDSLPSKCGISCRPLQGGLGPRLGRWRGDLRVRGSERGRAGTLVIIFPASRLCGSRSGLAKDHLTTDEARRALIAHGVWWIWITWLTLCDHPPGQSKQRSASDDGKQVGHREGAPRSALSARSAEFASAPPPKGPSHSWTVPRIFFSHPSRLQDPKPRAQRTPAESR